KRRDPFDVAVHRVLQQCQLGFFDRTEPVIVFVNPAALPGADSCPQSNPHRARRPPSLVGAEERHTPPGGQPIPVLLPPPTQTNPVQIAGSTRAGYPNSHASSWPLVDAFAKLPCSGVIISR